MTDLNKLKDFIMKTQVAAEQGECLMPNVTDVLNEIERLQALSLHNVMQQQRELLLAFFETSESTMLNDAELTEEEAVDVFLASHSG